MGVLEEHTSHGVMYWERYGNPCASADPCQQGSSLISTTALVTPKQEPGNYDVTNHLPQQPQLTSKSPSISMFSPSENSISSGTLHRSYHPHHPASNDMCINNNQPLSPGLKAASSAAAATESANCRGSSPSHDGLGAGQPAVDAHCAGCDQRIHDRFYLVAVERCWHSECLRCCECRRALDTATSCFARQSRIYCKDDYHRLFGVKRCAKCDHTLLPHELVMRARDWVFHVRCFSCEICNVQLSKGDTFGMLTNAIYCKEHYSLAAAQHPAHHSHSPNTLLDLHHSSNCNIEPPHHLNNSEGPFFHTNSGETLVSLPQSHPSFHPFPPASSAPSFHRTFPNCGSSPFYTSNPAGTMPFGSNAPEHFVKMSFVNNNSIINTPTSVNGTPVKKSRKRRLKEGLTLTPDSGADPYAEGFSPNGSVGTGQTRAKRMRTSFKHNQLRMLKSYFATNHNPDAKDLKQLSQKTSLSKRVLQVWFQNARAKWRRLVQKQDKNCADGGSPLPSLGKAGSAGLPGAVGAPSEDQLASMTTPSHQHLHYDDMSSSSAASISFPSPI